MDQRLSKGSPNLWMEYVDVPVINEDKIEIKLSKESILNDLEILTDSIRNCEVQKVRLFKLYEQKLTHLMMFQSAYPMKKLETKNEFEILCSMYNDSTLKIEINDTLPTMPKVMNGKQYQELRDYYIPAMNKAINKLKPKIEFERAFILFDQTFPTKRVRDFDNMFKSFVFDSLRYSKIIQDDCYDALTYFEKGEYKKGVMKTEIYVTRLNNMFELIIEKG